MSLPYFPPGVFANPRDMPELRRGFLDFAADDGPWAQSEMLRRFGELTGHAGGRSHMRDSMRSDDDGNLIVEGPAGYGPDELSEAIAYAAQSAENSMGWHQRHLAESQLIHVSADLTDILFASVDSVPSDTVLDEAAPPTPSGFVVFETPFYGTDSTDEGEEIRVDAVLWGPALLPDRNSNKTFDLSGVNPGYGFAAFRWLDPDNQADEIAAQTRTMTEHTAGKAMWLPLGHSDWITGDTIDTPVHHDIAPDGQAHASMMEDRRLMSALWSLIRSKRITQTTTVTAPKAARRRLERQGDTTDRTVEVIHLRSPEFRPTHADGSTGRKLGVRFAVRPHWRNQPYGPGRSLRRLILVPPHIKGPADAPFKHVERVWSVD